MNKELRNDIITWDIVNWARSLEFWDKNTSLQNKNYECLELGSSKGGMSLWLALKGNKVLCTDLHGPEADARRIHNKYNCASMISYDALDATRIPYENRFDVIIFKSILGGINIEHMDTKAHILNQIYKALKPGGKLLFTENLESTFLHRVLRKHFGTKGWDYLRIDQMNILFSAYKSVCYTTSGFFGCMGRNEWQRNALGNLDTLLCPIIPQKYKYILTGIAEK